MERMMNNKEFLDRVAYEERIHRELHGTAAAKEYTDALRKAKELADVEGAFDNATFNSFGLVTNGPFGN